VDQCDTHKAVLQSITLILDNTGSTGPVTWRVQITDTDHTGHLWATANPMSGIIAAGQSTMVFLIPASKLCQHTKGRVTYHALLMYQGEGQASSISITDTVAGP
jgi:hypothetical protein